MNKYLLRLIELQSALVKIEIAKKLIRESYAIILDDNPEGPENVKTRYQILRSIDELYSKGTSRVQGYLLAGTVEPDKIPAAYYEGINAREQGKGPEDNPYSTSINILAWHAWLDGFEGKEFKVIS